MCKLVTTNHQRYILRYCVDMAIGHFQYIAQVRNLRGADKTVNDEMLQTLYELKEIIESCETYYEEV